jgi:hypothetical protein
MSLTKVRSIVLDGTDIVATNNLTKSVDAIIDLPSPGFEGQIIYVSSKKTNYKFTGNNWVSEGQDLAENISYTPAGNGAVATDVQRKLREFVSVRDYGAVGNNVVDDTAAIQAAIDANGGKTIYLPAGFYRITAALTVSVGGTALIGDDNGSTFIFQNTPNEDGVRFAPPTAGVDATYLSVVRIQGVNVVATASAYTTGTSGAGVRFVQCNGYKLFNVSVNNFPDGITVEGGQLGSLKTFQSNASAGSNPYVGSALLNFKAASYGEGAKQHMFTTQVEDFRMSASKLRTSCIRIEDADGLNFSNGYIAFGSDDLIRVENTYDNSYIAAVSFANIYMDCVGPGKTPTAVSIPNDAFTNTSVFGLKFGSGCVFGNGDGYGVLCQKERVLLLSFDGCTFLNFQKHAINYLGVGLTTLTDFQITGCQFTNCGADGTGAIIRASGGRNLSITGNTFSSVGSATVLLILSGTWEQGTISGNLNASNVADITSTAVFTNGYSQSGNASRFTKGGTTSWVGDLYTELGGVVVQESTSGKATTLTLNTLEGQITTDAASLDAGATVRFTMINATIRSHDVVHVQRKSGGTGTSYRVWVDFSSQGSCGICIQNITGAPLAESLVLQFKVFRSAIT